MNNKVIYIVKMMAVLMGLFVCSSISAQNGNVREETARQVGLNFLRLKDGNPQSDLQLTRVNAVQYPNLYVYNTSENGFIVVASDNRMEPILAYSDEGTFDKDDVAPGANFWFEMYEYAIDSLVRNNVRDVDEMITHKWEDLINGVMPEPERSGNYPPSYGPLIGTHWGQGNPYNQRCPWNGENHAKTGCTATALAQVLNYYNVNIPQRTIWYTFRHNGNSVLSLIGANGNTYQSTPVNGCNLPEREAYKIGGWDNLSGYDRIAKIMLDCGLAVDMRYGLSESGAWNACAYSCPNESSAERALKLYFGFPRAQGFIRSNYNLSNWNEFLIENIVNNNPILYGGQKNSGGAHTFICDGYYYYWFHFNFGWYGSSDGYYLCTDPKEYVKFQNAVVANPTDLVIWNDKIPFGEQILDNRVWCGEEMRVINGDNPGTNQNNTIYYNFPGYYSLRNHCENTGKTLVWNVTVLPGYDKQVTDVVCKKSKYHKIFNFSINDKIYKAEFNLSREQTDFDNPTDFVENIYDNNGNIIGTCTLHLTTSGEVTEIPMDPVTMTYCEFKNNHNGVYNWNIPGVANPVKCYNSGHYEYTAGINNPPHECQTVYSFDLSIEMPPIIKDTTLTVCTNDYYLTWLPPYETIIQHFHVSEYAYGRYVVETLVDNCDKMFRFHCNYTAIDTIEEEKTKCMKDLPFEYRGELIGSEITQKGWYSYTVNVPKDPNDPAQCDKVYLLLLTVTEDCCKTDLDCVEEKLNEGNKSPSSNVETIYYGLKHYFEYKEALYDFLFNVFREVSWSSIEERNTFWNLFQSLLDSNTGMMSESAMQQLIATNPYDYITEEYIEELVERYNRSVLYWNEGNYTYWDLPEGYNPDFIEYDTASMNKAYEAYDYAIAHGFSDVKAMYDNAYELLAAEVDNIQSAVCAHVTVKFTQKMTMTREAFNGTLQIFNGHESIPMQDIRVDFRITDQQGNDCTNLFQINTLSLDQITGISGDGSLAAQTNGTAMVQFIPTKNAAPTQPVVYSFGGSFSFIDPFTGEGLTYPLYPVEITVNPSPDLYVDYFMQRDILGDDALTTNVVEPSIPAELGVIINNKGAGIAKNVILETAEPEIIDNEKGLAIDFAMYGASFNGSPRQLGLTSIPFGNIGSGQTAVGEWLFTSSLLGHFVSYEAHVIHNSSYGNPDLSLVSHLDIHELIHPIYAYGNLDDGINDFLVNDVLDAYDQPDSIYFSHGGRTAVGIVDNISFDHYVEPQDTIVILTINPSRIGWNYGVTEDPGRDNYDLVSCTRDFDGQVIPLNNVWQTFVTIPDSGDPIYENKLHIVDTLSNDVQDFTYTLVYSMKNNLLDVLEITGIPESYIDYPLESFTVRFNEAIIDSTFTYEDMTLKCQNGPNLMDSTIVITKVNDSIYDVNISGLTNETGLYVLNVSTLNIKDSRGYYGYKGKQATWVQVIEDYTQTMNFAQGWNWWSTYIEQEGIDGLGMLEEALGDNGITIHSQANGYTNYYENYGWYGSLSSIDNISSYKIKTSAPCSVALTGQVAVPSQHPITLGHGWTWIGYVPLTAMDVNEALSGLEATVGDKLKSQEGYAEYYEDYGWYGSLNTIEPDMGLMYYSSNDDPVTFTYPDNNRGGELKANLTPETNHWKPNIYTYSDNMTVMAVVKLEDTELSSNNYELAAFTTNGECRGSVRLIYAEPLHRYVAFLTISGKDAVELSFRLYDSETGEEYGDAEESLSFVANAIVGDANELYTIHFRGTMGVDELANRVQFYPNPVNRGERFSIDIAEDVKSPVCVEIVNALGVETLRATSVQMPATLTAPAVAGIYTMRITVEGKGTVVRKLVVR